MRLDDDLLDLEGDVVSPYNFGKMFHQILKKADPSYNDNFTYVIVKGRDNYIIKLDSVKDQKIGVAYEYFKNGFVSNDKTSGELNKFLSDYNILLGLAEHNKSSK